MPPEEDARAILRLALRHEQSLAASLDQAFAHENLLKGLIVLVDRQPPLSHASPRSGCCAGSWKVDWQTRAAKARSWLAAVLRTARTPPAARLGWLCCGHHAPVTRSLRS
jgi:hypothetical protein